VGGHARAPWVAPGRGPVAYGGLHLQYGPPLAGGARFGRLTGLPMPPERTTARLAHLSREAALPGAGSPQPVVLVRHRVHPGGLDLTVGPDDTAVVRHSDTTVGTFGPGDHRIHPEDLRYWCGGDPDGVLATWFVSTAPLPTIHAGGAPPGLDGRVRATAVCQVADPATLVATLAGEVDLTRPEALTYWLGRQVLIAAGDRDPEAALTGRLGGFGLTVRDITVERTGSHDVQPPGGGAHPEACRRCGQPAEASDRFCGRCGAALEALRCAGCSQPLRPGVAFCTSCGAPTGGSGTTSGNGPS